MTARRYFPGRDDLYLEAAEVVKQSPNGERAWLCVHAATKTRILKIMRWPDGQWCAYTEIDPSRSESAVSEADTLLEAALAGLELWIYVPPVERDGGWGKPSVRDVAGSRARFPEDWARLATLVALLGYPKDDGNRLQHLLEEGR